MTEPLEITVFGGRIGESIVVRLPGNLWGVVDNYTPALSNPSSNPALRYLEKHNVERLKFICLTHPHHDHYRGMGYLLRRFDPDHIWVFDALDHKHLQAMVAAVVKGKSKTSHLSREKEKSDELEDVMDAIFEKATDRHRDPQVQIRRMALELPLFRLNTSPPLMITALAVSGNLALRYEASLRRCFKPDGSLNENLAGVNHNLISGGLLIEYGSTRVILGGDMETESWEEAIGCFGSDSRLASLLFKASHHGSENGYCEGLWAKASPAGSCIAVITPYASQGLPSPEGIRHIGAHAKEVRIASASATPKEKQTDFTGLTADALAAIRALFPKSTTKKLEGFWSFSVGPNRAEVQVTGGPDLENQTVFPFST